MKKFFTFITALMAVVAVNATIVTLNPSDFSAATSAATSATVDGVTAAVTSGTITADQVRIFKNQTITISCEQAISAIVFTCTANGDAQYGPGCFEAQNGYSYNNKIGTWLGDTTAVSFKAATNQVRATKIEVYLDGEVPAEGQGEAIKATVAQAIAAGMLLDSAKTSEEVYEVTGYVVNSQPYNPKYKNQIWFMADDAANTGAQEFEAYACTVSEDKVIMQVIDGDKVTLTGSLTKYWDATNNKFLIEIKNGTALFVEKAEGDHSIAPAKVDTVNVAQAVEIGMALADNAKTDNEYVVYGYVVTAYAPNEGFTDQTWFMADEEGAFGEFEAYRCTPDTLVKEGDYVYVKGQIQKYVKDSKTQIEIGYGTAVHGATPAPPQVDTITVAQALEIAQALTPEKGKSLSTDEKYAVQGYVTKVKDAAKYTYYMADEAGAYGEFQAYRCASVDYEVAEGDLVIVTGKIMHYYGEGSNGEYHNYEISGGALVHVYGEGIENVVLTEKAQKVMVDGVMFIIRDGKMYNVQGAQVR